MQMLSTIWHLTARFAVFVHQTRNSRHNMVKCCTIKSGFLKTIAVWEEVPRTSLFSLLSVGEQIPLSMAVMTGERAVYG